MSKIPDEVIENELNKNSSKAEDLLEDQSQNHSRSSHRYIVFFATAKKEGSEMHD